ncbi:hypothetical protein JXB12_04655 [candidate division KSB1 bacterium]|nr:hypothetical protein [candidate division KSB1 bacterium]
MDKIKPYYITLDKSVGENFSEYEYSTEGVPMVRFNRSPDWQSNPVTVCQYALHHLGKVIGQGGQNSERIVLNQLSWLMNHIEDGPNDSAVWFYRLDIPFYKLSAPWISGMAQGEALSVFTRAFAWTGDERYLNIAHRIWRSFSLKEGNGGVVGKYPDNSIVIEEYPTQPCSCVLNGFILALFGIYDYAQITDKSDVILFYDDCIESLESNLHRYDTGYWSYYDLYKPYRLTSQAYHRLHLRLLDALSNLTSVSSFRRMFIEWKSYQTNLRCQSKWLLHKLRYNSKNHG